MTDTIITLNEQTLKNQLGELVRASVEETLNKMLDAEADQLANAGKYERTAARKDTRAGHYQRKLTTKAGEVTLQIPKLRHLPFETAIIERYKRRESSIEEALIEMYLAGVSVRRMSTPMRFCIIGGADVFLDCFTQPTPSFVGTPRDSSLRVTF